MGKHEDNETNKLQAVAEFLRDTYFVGCSFHTRFQADCGRCVETTERILDEEHNG